MKLSLKLAALLAAALTILAGGPFAAARQPEPPPGLAQGAAPLDTVPVLAAPPVDAVAELASITAPLPAGEPPRFGVSLAVHASPSDHGAWETLADGSELWRLRVRSDGAQAIGAGFARYAMPAGGRLSVYDPAYALVHGPYTAQDNEAHGQLWTPLAAGDKLVVEAQLPPGTPREQLQLELASVTHAVLDPFSPAMAKSGSCNLDVVCPEAAAWRAQIRSVARITYTLGGSAYLCTGALVNNTAQDRRPLFLTAAHCDITAANAATVVTYWNFQSPVCRAPGSAASAATGVGSLGQTLSGAYWRAEYAPADMTLLELDDPVPEAYQPYWAGWDRRADAPTAAVGIHHPSGHEKRISFEYDAAAVTSEAGFASPGDGTHIRVIDWDIGTTEPGSSGSPLFNQLGLVVGQLHSGAAACGNNGSDWYGRLFASWTGGGSPGTRLSDDLDPLGLGATRLAGLDSGAPLYLPAIAR